MNKLNREKILEAKKSDFKIVEKSVQSIHVQILRLMVEVIGKIKTDIPTEQFKDAISVMRVLENGMHIRINHLYGKMLALEHYLLTGCIVEEHKSFVGAIDELIDGKDFKSSYMIVSTAISDITYDVMDNVVMHDDVERDRIFKKIESRLASVEYIEEGV